MEPVRAESVPPAVATPPRAPSVAPRTKPRRRHWRVLALLFVLLLAADLARPAPDQLSARVLVGAIHVYQATLSKRMGAIGVRCRFTPTCSHFAVGAIQKDGALVGSARAAWRILRCGPWTKAGTYDPP
jgi:uncharacterized protein